jgi:hypothetical protein
MTDSADHSEPLCWIIGEKCIVLAREWQFGDQAGLSAQQVYIRIDEYEDLNELTSNIRWPETTSEDLAEGLAAGKLQRLEVTTGLSQSDG